MNFKDVYKLPLEKYEGMDKGFHANGHINGDDSQSIEHPLKYEDGYISIKKEDKWFKIMLVRGWGYLIGTGGLNLSAEEAAKIQDDFGNWIVETLSKKKE